MSTEEPPTGALTGTMHQMSLQLEAVERHAAAEGHHVEPLEALEVRDRALYPTSRHLRPYVLAERVRSWLH